MNAWGETLSGAVRGGILSRKIAFSGIFTGIAVLLLYISGIAPSGKLTLFFLASLPVSAAVIEFGVGAGAAVYFAACLLSLIFGGNIYGFLPFILFFGHYPIIKYFIEKGRKKTAEILMKLAIFNISVFLWYLLSKYLFVDALTARLNGKAIFAVALAAAAQGVFFLYDYVLSLCLFYYESRIKIIKGNKK